MSSGDWEERRGEILPSDQGLIYKIDNRFVLASGNVKYGSSDSGRTPKNQKYGPNGRDTTMEKLGSAHELFRH